MVGTLAVTYCALGVLLLASVAMPDVEATGGGVTKDTLRLVHAIFRHGDRTPADTYPKDPYINDTFEPFGWGALTDDGKRHQYEQGQWLRKRYGRFLGKEFSKDTVFAQSTDVGRTKMSMQLELAGLFPAVENQKWNKDLQWEPFPVVSEPLNEDKLLLVRIPCPAYHEELDKVLASEKVKTLMDKNRDDIQYWSEQTGLKLNNLDDIQSLYSTLKAEEGYGKKLPEWTKRGYPEPMDDLTAESFIVNAYTPKLQKLKGGVLLKKIISDLSAKAAKTLDPPSRKLFMYAGHDSTIANLLMAMKVWQKQIPVYNIMTLIELHQDKYNQYGVKVFLRNSTSHEPHALILPGCQPLCPLDKFITLSKDVIPEDVKDCKSDDPNFTPPPASGP